MEPLSKRYLRLLARAKTPDNQTVPVAGPRVGNTDWDVFAVDRLLHYAARESSSAYRGVTQRISPSTSVSVGRSPILAATRCEATCSGWMLASRRITRSG
jgi:hypothetical protein